MENPPARSRARNLTACFVTALQFAGLSQRRVRDLF